MKHTRIFFLFLLSLLSPTSARSQEVCIGINPSNNLWGLLGVGEKGDDAYCAEGSAVLAIEPLPRRKPPGWVRKLSGTCCPLPQGSLTGEHVFTGGDCPKNHVITGAKAQSLRCTKINEEKFSLRGPVKTLITEASPDLFAMIRERFGLGGNLTTRLRIPIELRFGVGRVSRSVWLDNLCIGHPWGSPLTSLGSQACDGVEFSELLPTRDLDSQVPRPCRALDNIYSPKAACLR